MSAAELLNGVLEFLIGDHDDGDIANTLFADQNLILDEGAIIASRGGSPGPRRANPPAMTIEVVPVGPWRQREVVGMGTELYEVVVHLECNVREKASLAGRTQLEAVDSLARALVRRYRDVTNLEDAGLAVTGATFIRSEAELVQVDDLRDSGEKARAVVRVAFVFMEDLADNQGLLAP